MIIRSAIIKDAPGLLSLVEQLGYSQTLEELESRLKIYCDSDTYQIFVVENSEKIIGFIALSVCELFVKPGKRCHIEALVMDKNYRAQGIGRQLIDHAEDYAKQKNCLCIDLTSGLRRAKEGSHDFYRSLGFKNEGPMAKLYFRKDLG